LRPQLSPSDWNPDLRRLERHVTIDVIVASATARRGDCDTSDSGQSALRRPAAREQKKRFPGIGRTSSATNGNIALALRAASTLLPCPSGLRRCPLARQVEPLSSCCPGTNVHGAVLRAARSRCGTARKPVAAARLRQVRRVHVYRWASRRRAQHDRSALRGRAPAVTDSLAGYPQQSRRWLISRLRRWSRARTRTLTT